ncbi:hypothetical protein BS47DRAFT_1345826, partial [Hydnum rufescens UP504]
ELEVSHRYDKSRGETSGLRLALCAIHRLIALAARFESEPLTKSSPTPTHFMLNVRQPEQTPFVSPDSREQGMF